MLVKGGLKMATKRHKADVPAHGVLIQLKATPGATYDVLGLAMVSEWRDGYFILEGFSPDGRARNDADEKDASHLRATVQAKGRADFEPSQAKDTRDKILAEVTRRRGQPKFRKQLISAYGSRCAISGCNAIEALEAAHITPYRGEDFAPSAKRLVAQSRPAFVV